MKIVLNIFCWLLAAYCIYFPFSYFGKEADRKEINVSHILVATQEEAENIKKQIEEEGKSFEEMATDIIPYIHCCGWEPYIATTGIKCWKAILD